MMVATGLLEQIDELAMQMYTNRSSIFRQALVEFVNKHTPPAKQANEPGHDIVLENILEEFQQSGLGEGSLAEGLAVDG